MNSSFTALVLLLAFAAASEAIVVHWGSGCPKPQRKTGFNLKRYLGHWHEIARLPCNEFEKPSRCVTAQYDLEQLTPNVKVRVNNTGILLSNGKETTSIGEVHVINGTIGALNVRFSKWQPDTSANYNVLDTDYDTFSIVWSCIDLRWLNLQYMWILSRTPTMEPAKFHELTTKIEQWGIKLDKLIITPQKHCQ